jgi:hypothetical protein
MKYANMPLLLAGLAITNSAAVTAATIAAGCAV